MSGLQSRANGSAITTSNAARNSRIGEPPGGLGCNLPLSSTDRGGLLTPAEVDASLKTSLPPSVEFVSQASYSLGEYGYEEHSCLRIADGADGRELSEATASVVAALRPCSSATLRRELARLRVVTASRTSGQDSLDLTMAAYAEELAAYPDDVVVAVCRKRYRFWPALQELLDAADELVAPRREMFVALKSPPIWPAEPVDYSETRRLVAERDRQWAEAAAWREAHPELMGEQPA